MFLNEPDTTFTFEFIVSVIVAWNSINILKMLKRTEFLGPTITMMVALRLDLFKFFKAFFLPWMAIFMVGIFNSKQFTGETEAFDLFLQLF